MSDRLDSAKCCGSPVNPRVDYITVDETLKILGNELHSLDNIENVSVKELDVLDNICNLGSRLIEVVKDGMLYAQHLKNRKLDEETRVQKITAEIEYAEEHISKLKQELAKITPNKEEGE